MKLPWVSRKVLEAERDVFSRRLHEHITIAFDNKREALRLKELLRVADDTADFWKDSYGAEYETHEKTKKEKAFAEERWSWWRNQADIRANRNGEKEAEKAKAGGASENTRTTKIRLARESAVRQMRIAQRMLDTLCCTLDTGRLDKETFGGDAATRRGR